MQEQEPVGPSAEACRILDDCASLPAEDRRQIALGLIGQLLDLHHAATDDLINRATLSETDRQELTWWAADASRLQQAEMLMEMVAIPLEGEACRPWP
jgi:hypothetical protein